MTAAADHTADHATKASRKTARNASRRGAQLKHYANSEIQSLSSDVEELVERIGDSADADIKRLRSKITETLANVKQLVADSAENIGARTRAAATATDEFVHERPWTTIGIAALLALLVGVGVKAASARR
jgi:ElaB/YqjD/DUF883 family membrane-anchored ribosome-binding protein